MGSRFVERPDQASEGISEWIMYEKIKNYSLNQPYLRPAYWVYLITPGFVALITPLTPGALIMLVGGLELSVFGFFCSSTAGLNV